MLFKDFLYKRPDFEDISNKCSKTIDVIMNANDVNEVFEAIDAFNVVRCHWSSMESIASIRHSINTLDEFYNQEMEFYDEFGAKYTELENRLSISLIKSPHHQALVAKYGDQLFKMIKVQLESFSPEIIPELQEEAKLVTRHGKLIASAKIPFDGKILNLSQMGPYMTSTDRQVRIDAETATWKFFEENIQEIDEIYDSLVRVRDRMAKKLGYKNYIDLGYKRLGRTDYNSDDVKTYRDQVYQELVPIANQIYLEQAKRIGIEDFKSYDIPLEFLDGNAKPLGDLQYKIDCARKLYHELSDETKEFVDFMLDHQLIDLEAKPGKQGGGYCTSIPDYKAPFVFSNFNGTSGDVDVLTHEFGHAFQNYCSRDFKVLEYMWPTLESCEIHSMSMEFFAWPWMDLFFGEAQDKYKYSHLSGSITFIPYGVLVDEFQHWVYENPESGSDARKVVWREMEKKYMPWKKYDNEFLEKGNYWIRQSHIFSTAFYYIDYTLAQNCAHQFWVKNQEDHQKAWEDYYRLCKTGGSKSFLELLKVANLKNPFVQGTVKYVTEPLKKWLDEFDLSKI